MKYPLILFLVTILTSCSSNTLEGKVYYNHQPCSFGKIRLIATPKKTYTLSVDKTGSYLLRDLPAGHYLVVVEFPRILISAAAQLNYLSGKREILEKYPLMQRWWDVLDQMKEINASADSLQVWQEVKTQRKANEMMARLPKVLLMDWDTSRNFTNPALMITEIHFNGQAKQDLEF